MLFPDLSLRLYISECSDIKMDKEVYVVSNPTKMNNMLLQCKYKTEKKY